MDTKKRYHIHQSRLTSQNPYAHVASDDGELVAILPPLVSVQEVRGTTSPKTTTAVRFHGNSFPSLAEFFKLSTEAVAIRIEYFELIDF